VSKKYEKYLIRTAFTLLLFFFVFTSGAQDQPLADSLKLVLTEVNPSGVERLEILSEIAYQETSVSEGLRYSQMLIKEAKEINHQTFLTSGYLALGAVYSQSGNISLALESLMKGATIATEQKDRVRMAQFFGQIAIVYSINDDTRNALMYQKKAMKEFIELKDTVNIGVIALNIAFDYYSTDAYDSAHKYNIFARKVFEDVSFATGIGYAIGNQALVDWKTGDIRKGETGLLQAVSMLTPLGDDYAIADYKTNLAQLYFESGRVPEARQTAENALQIARKEHHQETVRDALRILSKIYEKQGALELALWSHKQYVSVKDSIQNLNVTQQMADLRTEFEVANMQVEIDQLAAEKKNRDFTLFGLAVIILVLVISTLIIYKSFQTQKKLKAELENLNQSKDKLFSILSHDLKGPISAFAIVSKLIKSAVLSQNAEVLNDLAEEIKLTSDQLSNMLENLLLWTIDEKGDFRQKQEIISPKELLNELETTYKTMAQSKSIQLAFSIDNACHVFADRNATLTILRNLLSNALKFTAPGGAVSLEVTTLGQTVVFTVKDNGIGMSTDQLSSLFKFVGNTTSFGTSGEKGLGLGLNLAYKMVKANNGDIKVTSELGTGSTFSVSLPSG
jgi:signal transduction histidine kinase